MLVLSNMYSVVLSKSSKKFLRKVSRVDAEMVLKKIYSIRENPFRFLKRLSGNKFWRLRIRDYRAVVDVVVSGNNIVVLRIGHRKNVY